jgi:DNA-binding NtrC family response regulator
MRMAADSAMLAASAGARPRLRVAMISDAYSPLCLLIEDQALIGMALEATLEDAGFRVAGPFTSNAEALAWLELHTPDLALLDVLLRDGPCTGLVRALRRRSIPFAIYSGLKPGTLPPDLQETRWLEKPASRMDLTSMLREIAPKPADGATAPREPAELAAHL